MAADDDLLIKRPAPPEPTEKKPHPWAIILSLCALLVAALSTLFSCQQAHWSRIQATEAMRARSEAKAAFDAQANDVERSRKAAEDSAIAAGRLADAAQKSLNITERSAKAAERSTRIADESRQVEQQILQNSIDTFRSEQRPWLMVDKTEPDYDKKLGMTVYLTNRGKTPAYRVRNEVSFEYGEASLGKDMNMQFARMGKEKFMSSIDPPPVLPDGHETYSLQLSGPVLQYVNKYSVRVVGLVTYFDLYEKEYHVNLCFEAHPTVRQIFLSPCMEQDANVSK